MEPRVIKAGNSGPFTLDGSRTYLIGGEEVAVIDPGPDEEGHIRALSAALESAREVRVLLTHHHRDHAGGALRLARETGGVVLGPQSCRVAVGGIGENQGYGGPNSPRDPSFHVLGEGERISTSEGDLVTLEIPGHTRDHLAFHWEAAGALFVGDLLLGKGDTTWVGEYLGSVADYLSSLDRVEALGPSVIYPGHGPALSSPLVSIDHFRRHRLKRLDEVRRARRDNPDAGPEEWAKAIYGSEIPAELQKAARASVEAALFHLELGEG